MHSEKEALVFAVVAVSATLFFLAAFIIIVVARYYKAIAQKNRDIIKAVFVAQENERTRIAEELHDDIGGNLSSLKMLTGLVKEEAPDENTKQVAAKNLSIIEEVIKKMRAIVRNQASKYLISNGFAEELAELCNHFSSIYKIHVSWYYHPPRFIVLKNDFEINQFRIFQELLHNSVKHAQCTRVDIKINVNELGYSAHYSDNGKGFDAVATGISGMGLQNIQTRCKMFDGQIEFASNEGTGMMCHLYYPVKSISLN